MKRKPNRSEWVIINQSKESETMLISTKGRYALRLLSDLAEHRDQGAV